MIDHDFSVVLSQLLESETRLSKQLSEIPQEVFAKLLAHESTAEDDIHNRYQSLYYDYVEWLTSFIDKETLISPVEARDHLVLLGQSKGLLKAGDED